MLKHTTSVAIRTGLVADVTWDRTMRTIALTIAATVIAAGPARAQLTTLYKGVQREGPKDSPATAQFSIEEGRVGMVMKGSHSSRMLFLEKEHVLRIVDGWRRYFDGPEAPFSWGPENAEVLESGTLAMTTGPVRDGSGKITGRFSSVWRLEPDGRWRVIFDRECSCA